MKQESLIIVYSVLRLATSQGRVQSRFNHRRLKLTIERDHPLIVALIFRETRLFIARDKQNSESARPRSALNVRREHANRSRLLSYGSPLCLLSPLLSLPNLRYTSVLLPRWVSDIMQLEENVSLLLPFLRWWTYGDNTLRFDSCFVFNDYLCKEQRIKM